MLFLIRIDFGMTRRECILHNSLLLLVNHVGSLSIDKYLSDILLDHTNRHNVTNI